MLFDLLKRRMFRERKKEMQHQVRRRYCSIRSCINYFQGAGFLQVSCLEIYFFTNKLSTLCKRHKHLQAASRQTTTTEMEKSDCRA